MNRKLGLVIILLLILAGFFSYRTKIKLATENLFKKKLPAPIDYQTEQKINNQTATTTLENKQGSFELNLKVPFTAQAPEANWNETFKEACEEASVLMVDYYYQNKTFTPQEAAPEILKMVDWQIKNFGGHFDLTALQTAELIKNYLGIKKVEIIENPTIEDIKNEIKAGRPVIVPAAGQLLGNPYFRNPGPIYHMLVIKGYIQHQLSNESGAGYTTDKFITNDPGTKRGQDYLYDFKTIMTAMHDWNLEDINQGAKRVIVIYPN